PPPGEGGLLGPDAGPDPGPGPGDGTIIGAPGLSMTMNEVTEDWPLLRYLADDPVYFARYKTYVKSFASSVFTESRMDALFAKHHALIAPHVIGADGEQPGYTHLRDPAEFAAGLAELKDHARARRAVAAEFAP
ncbi:MAG TPA: CotH kinase family protein, partial [Terriglobales bacterium]|nr:CotH kinase family protein [Terriglobales bacterium]